MPKRPVDDDAAAGIPTPRTPESDAAASGDHVLAEFTQTSGPRAVSRKRQRIEVSGDGNGAHSARHGADVHAAQCGVIERIELANFMCHDHFEVELGPQINFIVGANGSGKSAILTAIAVGLGAKAAETNRGASLRALIKSGSSSARISIVFRNGGAGAYRPDVYGSRITVQRILRRDGAGKYALRSAAGRHVSDKKHELDAMLAAFGVTVNNPMAVLTQDAAKSFIATSSDEDKYKFFMAGTKADETIKNYHETAAQLAKVRQRLAALGADVQALKQRDADARILFERYENQDELLRMRDVYAGKYLWVQVRDRERKVERSRAGVADLEAQIANARRHIREAQEANVRREQQRDAATERAVKADLARAAADARLETRRDELKRANAELGDAKAEIAATEREIASDDARLAKMAEKIRAEEEHVRAAHGGSGSELAARREHLTVELAAANAELAAANRRLLGAADAAADERAAARAQAEAEHRFKAGVELQLKQLRGSSGSRLDAFGRNVRRVLAAIEKDPGFHHRPLGPLGRYVDLKQDEERWSSLLEQNLGKTLSAFVVHDQHDFQRLSQILRNYNCRSTIVVKKHETFDYAGGSAGAEHKRVVDVLSIADPFVRCVLVDLNGINRVLLAETRADAEAVLRSNTRNVNSILVPYDMRSGNQLKSNRFGGLQIDVVLYKHGLEKLGSEAGSEHQVARLQQTIRASQRKIDELKQRERAAADARRDTERQAQRDVAAAKTRIADTERQIADIDFRLDDAGSTSRLDALQEEHRRLSTEIDIKRVALEDLAFKLQARRAAAQQLHQAFKADAQGVKALRDDAARQQELLAALGDETATAERDVKHYENSIAKRDVVVASLEQAIRAEREAIETLAAGAAACCSRADAALHDDDSLESIERDKHRIDAEVSDFETSIGLTREEVTRRFETARADYRAARDKVAEVAQLQKSLEHSLDDRLVSFEKMRADICSRVNDSFQKSLALRQFTGRIVFDFARLKLTMLVSTKRGEKLRNVESFSGGEKSFAQISLLLAIWDFMNTRIRGLDEFDVFMDQVNRTLSLRLILQKIRDSPSQTIFITPLEIAGVDGVDGQNVHVHRIPDPQNRI